MKTQLSRSIANGLCLLALGFFGTDCAADNGTGDERPIYVSMQQLLSDTGVFLKQNVIVTGYLSDNCSGTCLFAYKDDSVNFNEVNSLKLMMDAGTLHAIRSSCQESYVTLTGTIGAIEGFGRPGFTEVEMVRRDTSGQGASEICWMLDED